MTNHNGATGPAEHQPDPHGPTPVSRPAHGAHPGGPGVPGLGGAVDPIDCPEPDTPIKVRSASELADALPYILGYRPEDCVVLLGLRQRDGYGRFGGRVRLGIPARAEDWPAVARQLARSLIIGGEHRGDRSDAIVVFVCKEPTEGETGRRVRDRLQLFVQLLRTSCGDFGVPVVEALCISDGRFWSYCCPGGCCPPEGTSMGLPGSSALAAAATYAGLQVRGSLKEFQARLRPKDGAAPEQEAALDAARRTLRPRIDDETSRPAVTTATLDLARRAMVRLADRPTTPGRMDMDDQDDALLTHDEAAALIVGLQDRETRDEAAEWMEGTDAELALRLWRALARRCVGPYGDHAAALLTLAGWAAWSTGDSLEAREALAMALAADPDYLFAWLLHTACNEGLGAEAIRECIRRGRAEREAAAEERAAAAAAGAGAEDRGSAVGHEPTDVDDEATGADGEQTAAGQELTATNRELTAVEREAEAAEGMGSSRPVLPAVGATALRSSRTGAALRRANARQRAAGGARGPRPKGPSTRPGGRPARSGGSRRQR
ncbi:DUF4192 domain-containing protein [Streptomyces uncialis]|uniref:DUF4192 domain-containing protein n=1 Tax=Streptomyces uncialis TaxID=1048205 RepID=A0A1Q4V653_9ACTN|nr:DUF4192 domain-containing protein [Streptomyces uncialis]OKH93301.1 hypothetical protein AB852_17290 [Streptomyces uncialis]